MHVLFILLLAMLILHEGFKLHLNEIQTFHFLSTSLSSYSYNVDNRANQLNPNNIAYAKFRTDYSYDRENVLELSRFILYFIDGEPNNVSTQEIYLCIVRIYNDWEKNWTDNPDGLGINLDILLTISLGSNWFTYKQDARMRTMKDEIAAAN
jgi:hypothetical protein